MHLVSIRMFTNALSASQEKGTATITCMRLHFAHPFFFFCCLLQCVRSLLRCIRSLLGLYYLHCTRFPSIPHHATDPSCPPGGSSASDLTGCVYVCAEETYETRTHASCGHVLHQARSLNRTEARPCLYHARRCRFLVPAGAASMWREATRMKSDKLFCEEK